MPASAGRVRMPHNNRMSTSASLKSSAIWQKAIGHDPYAGKDESGDPTDAEAQAGREKAAQVMAAARQQNLTDGASRDDFAQKMYRGLKQGKRRRADMAVADTEESRLKEILDQQSSSSEDEFVEREKPREKVEKKSKKRSKKKKKRRHSSDEDSSSSDESSRRRERRKQKDSKKKRRRKERKRRSYSSDSSDSKDRRRRERKRRDKDRKKKDRSKKCEPKETFISSDTFQGSRKGYAFRMGDKGVGYYIDQEPAIDKKERDEALKLFQE